MLYTSPLLTPLLAAAQQELPTPLLYHNQTSYTAREILEKSQIVAQQLAARGMRAHDKVVIAVAPGAEFLEIMYATVMLRVTVALIDPEMGRDLYAAKLNQLQPQWAFVDSRLLLLQEHPIIRFAYFKLAQKPLYFPRYKNLQIISCGPRLPLIQRTTPLRKLLKANYQPLALIPNETDHEYLITYTSGTLQEPKGVLHSFSSLSLSINLLSKVVANRPGDKMATYLPHFVMLGVAAQLPIYIYNPNLSVTEKLQFFIRYQINILFGPPSDFLPLVQHCEKTQTKLPGSFKHLMLGSAPVHKSFLSRLVAVCPAHIKITITYGMTEHLLVSTADGHEKIKYASTGDLVGKPAPGVTVKIADDGELFLQSEQLFARYFHLSNRPEYHATGDLARLDAAGNILLMGRKKEMIIRRDTNIYPALYEDTIKKIPGVEEAAMVGIYNSIKADEEVYLAVETSKPYTAKQLLDKISYGEYQIEKNALPDEILFMPVPRKGRQNKIDRAQLADLIKKQR